jgi:hypothetical protein
MASRVSRNFNEAVGRHFYQEVSLKGIDSPLSKDETASSRIEAMLRSPYIKYAETLVVAARDHIDMPASPVLVPWTSNAQNLFTTDLNKMPRLKRVL